MIQFFHRVFRNWPPPSPQGPVGLQQDAEFAAPGPGIAERIIRYWRGIPVYQERVPKQLRPIVLRDPRAVRNEQAAAERRRAKVGDLPIRFIGADRPPPYSSTDL